MAQRGVAALRDAQPDDQMAGVYNVAVFGRSVTLVLQTMRSVDREAFDAWYAPWADEMKADPVMGYFVALRNEILKEGPPGALGGSVYVESLTGAEMAALTANPPPNARGFFVGDDRGGSGWHVELPDGTTTKYYVKLPESMAVTASVQFPDPPSEHAGKPLATHQQSIAALCRLYIADLERLVAAAEERFGS